MRAQFLSLLVAGIAILGPVETTAWAETPVRAYKIKAAFILDVARQVQWPNPVGPVARLCTIGADPFGDAWGAIQDQRIQGRPLQIERNVPKERIGDCMILAIGDLSDDEANTLAQAIDESPILTVADDATPASVEAILRLKSVDNRLHFDLDLPQAQRSGLLIGAQIRELADSVDGNAADGNPQ
jgi:YfiR/HmsC-like